MTHEPECRSFDGGHICICDVIRPAYQRGREDAVLIELKGESSVNKNNTHSFDHNADPRGDSTKCIPKQSQSVSRNGLKVYPRRKGEQE